MTQARRIVKLDPEDDLPTFHCRASAAVAEYLGAEQDLVPSPRPSFLKRPEDLPNPRPIPRTVSRCHGASLVQKKQWRLTDDTREPELLEEGLACSLCRRFAMVEVVQ